MYTLMFYERKTATIHSIFINFEYHFKKVTTLDYLQPIIDHALETIHVQLYMMAFKVLVVHTTCSMEVHKIDCDTNVNFIVFVADV